MACLLSSSQNSYLCIVQGSSFQEGGIGIIHSKNCVHHLHPIVSLSIYYTSFFHQGKDPQTGNLITGHSSGVVTLGLRGHIEDVSTETSQGGSSSLGCGVVDAALIHQIAVPIAGQDCRAGPLAELRRWLPPSWGPRHRSIYQPVHGGLEGMGFSSVFPGIRSHLMMMHWCFWAPVYRDYIMSSGESFHSFYPRTMGAENMRREF